MAKEHGFEQLEHAERSLANGAVRVREQHQQRDDALPYFLGVPFLFVGQFSKKGENAECAYGLHLRLEAGSRSVPTDSARRGREWTS